MKPGRIRATRPRRVFVFAARVEWRMLVVPSVLLGLSLAAPFAAAQGYLNCDYAPGWQQNGPARQYTAANLFEYKDGAAEGYLSFGFVGMTGITCKSGENTIDIDISEMKDPDSAWGIFAANSDPKNPVAAIGMGGQVEHQTASFARGAYYVEIVEVATDPEADSSATMTAFAVGIERQIQGRDTPPETLKWFPGDDLISVRLVPESVLGLRELRRGYVARYKQGQAFVIEQASPESAAATLESLREKLGNVVHAGIGDESFQTKTKYLGGLCIFRKGSVLGGYANLPEAADAVTLAGKLALRLP